MKKTIKIIIANKCKISMNENAITFVTRCAKSQVFNIPHSQIEGRRESAIEINDVYAEPAIEYTITLWIYSKIKEYTDKMHKNDFIMPKSEK